MGCRAALVLIRRNTYLAPSAEVIGENEAKMMRSSTVPPLSILLFLALVYHHTPSTPRNILELAGAASSRSYISSLKPQIPHQNHPHTTQCLQTVGESGFNPFGARLATFSVCLLYFVIHLAKFRLGNPPRLFPLKVHTFLAYHENHRGVSKQHRSFAP